MFFILLCPLRAGMAAEYAVGGGPGQGSRVRLAGRRKGDTREEQSCGTPVGWLGSPAAIHPKGTAGRTMTDRRDAAEETAADPPPEETAATDALPPAVWVTGLIVLVVLLLAVFGLN